MTTADQHQNSSNDSRPWLAPHRFAPGRSGNPSGRPKGSKSLKEYFQEMAPEQKLALVEHIYEGAMSGHTAVAAKYAELILNHSGEGGAFKVSVEARGWDSFQLAVLQQLGMAPQIIEGERTAPESSRVVAEPD